MTKHKRVTGAERDAMLKRVVAAYEKGDSVRAIATREDRSYGAIHRMLSEADNVTFRGRGGATRGAHIPNASRKLSGEQAREYAERLKRRR